MELLEQVITPDAKLDVGGVVLAVTSADPLATQLLGAVTTTL